MAQITIYDGDDVERDNGDWIRQNIPEYEELWSRFIGHDGKGKPPVYIGELGKIKAEHRELFSQAHYSVLVSLLTMRSKQESLEQSLGRFDDSNGYLKLNSELNEFMTQLGKIRDLFETMDNCLQLKGEVWRRFDGYYKQRNALIHGSVPPLQVDGGFVSIPGFGKGSGNEQLWNENSRWSDSSGMKFTNVVDFVSDTFVNLLPQVRAALTVCLDRICDLAGSKLPKLSAPVQLETQSLSALKFSDISVASPCISATNQKPPQY